MTNTKWLSALLAGTALSVASTAAMADTTFLTMTRNAASEGVTFMVSPTADMPAAATEVSVSGEVRVRAYQTTNGDTDSFTDSRARVVVKGKTETAVGQVGAYVRFQSTDGGNASASKQYGYWQATPELQLLAGRTDSIAAVQAGVDWNHNGDVAGGLEGPTNGTYNQLRMTYATGPASVAIALEDASPSDGNQDDYGLGAALTFEVSSGIQVTASGITASSDDDDERVYFVGAGANLDLGMFGVTGAVGDGKGYEGASYQGDINEEDAYNNASIGVTFDITEGTYVQANYGMTKEEDEDSASTQATLSVFYAPVSQLTLGAGIGAGESDDSTDRRTVGVGAWFKF